MSTARNANDTAIMDQRFVLQTTSRYRLARFCWRALRCRLAVRAASFGKRWLRLAWPSFLVVAGCSGNRPQPDVQDSSESRQVISFDGVDSKYQGETSLQADPDSEKGANSP